MRIAAALVALIVFVVIISGGILYTFNQTRVYQADGTLEIIDPSPVPSLQLEDLIDDTVLAKASTPADAAAQSGKSDIASELDTKIRSAEDMETQIQLLLSNEIVRRVEQRLRGEERERFMAPFLAATQLSGPLTPTELLRQNRSVERMRLSRMVRVRFTHPDPIIAARVANLFMEAYINRQLTLEIDGYMKIVEDLRIRIEQLNSGITELNESTEAPTSSQQSRLSRLEELRDRLTRALDEAKIRVNLANPEARIVDRAVPPPADRPIKPDVPASLAMTFAVACALSLTCFALGCALAPRRKPIPRK